MTPDNCQFVVNADQADFDGDGLGGHTKFGRSISAMDD